ncbi:unnamed protein product [Rotaria sordida]|uniref:Uncharacterized protein n=1 Tax=Rotaria sordida TaxID=392033 RepID=A0A819DDG6_9BILA|nr:unnamed protein product [Rotaria sordida]CAF1036420.1 unnamed protein product [Rotaria sordida]CAF1066125.1 unnamed protein product [Rotaria sordida]CAF3751546.1 unnamed protein product [Rotaria sordida]CAF3835261.1 unnamed protein product [Rotaria sordida]
MKAQLFTFMLFTIGVLLFQSAYTYHFRKRELTEYDLTSFIVNTCSADKIELLIQNLCDQTLQSALMGSFPYLTYYCKMIGSGNRYCDNINRYILAEQNIETHALMSRRFVRSLYKKNKLYQNREETDTDIDLKQKMILEICMTSTEKNSIETHRFCNQTLKDIQRGRYPEIKRLCKSYPGFNYCQRILSFSSLLSEPLSKESSSLLSSLPSTTPNIYRSSVPLEFSKSSDVESIIDQQRMNKSPLS